MILNQILSDQSDTISRSTALATRTRSMEIFTVIVFGELPQHNPFCVVFTLIQGSI
jgi:hypothetical protein